MKIRKPWLKAAAVGGSALLTAAGALSFAAPSAFADVSGASLVTPQATTTVYAGKTAQPAGNWVFTVPSSAFTASDTITFQIAPPAGSNCAAVGQTIGFASTPTVSVAATNGTTSGTAPTISAATSEVLTDPPLCTSLGIKDLLTLTFTNSASPTGTGTYTVTVSGVSYDVGSAAVTAADIAAGTAGVAVTATYKNGTGATGTVTNAATNGASNATVANVAVTANSPAVALAPSAADAAISDVVISESTATGVPTGFVCVELPTAAGSATFDTATAPTITASGGGAVAGSATVTSSIASFDVTTASSTAPATYTLSGLAINAPAGHGPITAKVLDGGTNSACSAGAAVGISGASAIRLAAVATSTQTYGTNADGTAAATFQQAYPPISSCAGGTQTGGNSSAVLARNNLYPDALSAAYLAGKLKTGILLTPTDSLSTSAINVLRLEGVTTVYIVGGPLAVSDGVQTQLESTQAWGCAGSAYGPLFTTAGTAQDIHVLRIYGQDRYGTAQQVAEFFGAGGVDPSGTAFSGAYNTANGDSANVPATAMKTAILATGENFRDAMSASPVAFAEHMPIILTTSGALSSEASTALLNLGIQQVIVMGGTAAVSANVVTAVQGMGIYTHRIGGADGTDTAQMLAQFEIANVNTNAIANGLNWTASEPTTPTNYTQTAFLVRGDYYPDGLTGSVWAGTSFDPMLLTESPSTLGKYTTGFLNMAGGLGWSVNSVNGTPPPAATLSSANIYTINVLGGPLAVNSSTIAAALQAISQG